jgi:hypothetical protein
MCHRKQHMFFQVPLILSCKLMNGNFQKRDIGKKKSESHLKY